MKKIKYIIIFLLMGCNAPQPVEELPLIKEFEGKENYRIWTTKKQFDGQGLMYAESKYFVAYDTLNRVINKNNSTFYYYDSANKIIEEKSIFRRDRIVKVMTKTYEYNKDGSLELILRIGESIDTIQKIIYDDYNRIIASNSRHKKVTFEYHQDRLIRQVTKNGNYNPKVSNFSYDSLGRLTTDNWLFADNQKMKTTFKYDDKNRLILEIDSSCNKETNPNAYVEFMTEYKYNANDSIIAEINSGRVLSKETFKSRGKTTFEYEIVHK